MPDFTYEALARTGTKSTGTLTANSEREAAHDPRRPRAVPAQDRPRPDAGHRRPAASLRQDGSRAGTSRPCTRSSPTCCTPACRCCGRWKCWNGRAPTRRCSRCIRDVRAKVADGTGLAQAMAQHPQVFNELAVSMVRAGQEGGFLEDVLKRDRHFVEHQEDLKAKVVGALAYPVFLAVAGFVVLNILMIFFVPKFEPIFEKLKEKGELPALTHVPDGRSATSSSRYWWLVLLIGDRRRDHRLPPLDASRGRPRHRSTGVKIRLPLFGTIFLCLALSRFSRILGTMLHNGIPILKALHIAKDSTGNRVLAEAIEKSRRERDRRAEARRPAPQVRLLPGRRGRDDRHRRGVEQPGKGAGGHRRRAWRSGPPATWT